MAIDPSVSFYMRVPLGGGEFTDGRIDYNGHPGMLGLADIDLTDERCLDIAANDGFWTFWAERRGATDCVAIDVTSFEHYDWGYDGPPDADTREAIRADVSTQWAAPGAGFRALHDHFSSKSERLALSVYELDPKIHGEFDLVFNYGLLYHLRHPLLSLDRVRAVTRGALILETHIVNGFHRLPTYFFYEHDQFREPTNWTGPTVAAVATWLRSAGFHDLWVRHPRGDLSTGRAVFAAALTEKWSERFAAAPGLTRLGDEFFSDVRRATQRLLGEEDR